MNFWSANSFRGKSVFLTGHTGFKGAWLCHWLHRLGADVTAYSLDPPTEPNNFTVSGVREKLANHHSADIRDAEKLESAIRDAQPDLVMHLAAQSVVKTGHEEPRDTFETNVMGTVNVLDAVRRLGRPCSVVIVTSDKCYENCEQVWGYREIDSLGERDPYGGSKGAAELVVRSYRETFFPTDRIAEHGIKVASARAGNVIGGGDWTPHALIVDVVHALANNKPISIRAPHANRPWQHVLQALSGYLTLAARLLEHDDPDYCSGWNIGPLPGNELPVHEIVDLFIQHWGEGQWTDDSQGTHMHEAGILRLNIDKALWKLDWKPCWSVREAVQYTAQWFKEYLADPTQAEALCIRQIDEFENTMRGNSRSEVIVPPVNTEFDINLTATPSTTP